MQSQRRIAASLIALLTASGVAAGSASVAADSRTEPQSPVSTPCLDELAARAPDIQDPETIGSLPLIGTALSGGILSSNTSPGGARQVPLDCVGVDMKSDDFLINHISVSPGGS